ncbi:hypothetical protein ABIE53_003215 [Burkholderia sp. OAS925]|uniref:Putative transmembrane lipoprotein n=1 Tax=Paraburkholderia graminis (strain ATCC 700544 / DSM 17151 / LMG 18924 / NCIMB 13744 / C4D1M) TaxID=396598 RepID=B1G2U7_PARG4|nr:DUF4136 domain-containing protein [Paraburkholderia graminis]EDT09609.1 putative transmembrane lipoprotein [Paraburkholderia graminis C4D1M]MDR6467790.1 hypothetical protein [Paraburkholderia graminis]MDR6472947.1 hypothetical protein [Paraburkholderia graminis]CAB3688773.1 hypothetical protein R8871_02934 [Paraburkholderia graminis C4D1M]
MTTNIWTRRAMLLLAALSVLLSGCTTYVTTQVTAFSDWSGGDAARTYAFTREPDQRNNLELTTYERIIANELATHAFRQVDGNDARYLVGLSYGIRSDMVTVAEPVYYNPWPAPYWGWGRPYDPWGPWGPFPAGYVNQSYPIFTHLLGVRITERATGKEVYNVTARNSGGESSLVRAMPYLARSALADFPLGNGVVRTVKIPLGNSAGASNETAVPAAAASPAAASGAKAVQ